MSDYGEINNQDVKSIKEDDAFLRVKNENLELFKRALSEGLEAKFRKTEEKIENIEMPKPSKRHKTRMNRLFRERVSGTFLPFPEVDNLYERLRSGLVKRLKIKKR